MIPIRLFIHPLLGPLGTILRMGKLNVRDGIMCDEVASSVLRRETTPHRISSQRSNLRRIKRSNVVPQARWNLVKKQPQNMASDCVARVVFHRTLGMKKNA